MPRWLSVIAAFVLVLLGAALMYVIEAGSGLTFMPTDKVGPSEFISIILTALGVILAAVTLMIGVLAIMGWSTFQELVERRAEASSKEFLEDRFSDGDPDYLQFIENIKEDVRLRLLAWTRENQAQWADGEFGDEGADSEEADPDA